MDPIASPSPVTDLPAFDNAAAVDADRLAEEFSNFFVESEVIDIVLEDDDS